MPASRILLPISSADDARRIARLAALDQPFSSEVQFGQRLALIATVEKQ